MSVYNQTYEQSSYIKDLASSQGFDVGLLYDPCLKDLDSSQGFNVGIQSKYVQSSMHQRPGFKPGF